MNRPIWTTEKRKVKDLIPWPRNPRRITETKMMHLKESLNKFGYADPVIANVDEQLIAGHMRLKAMAILKMVTPDTDVDVRIPNRRLTEDEAKELAVRHNGKFGEWNMEMLSADFTYGELLNFGFEKFELGFDMGNEPQKESHGEDQDPEDDEADGKEPQDSQAGDSAVNNAEIPSGNRQGGPSVEPEALDLKDIEENNPKLQAFLDRRRAAKERGKDKGELNFWLCIVFQSYEQKMEFSTKLGLETKYGMYANGEEIAKKIALSITETTQKPVQVPLDKVLSKMVQQ